MIEIFFIGAIVVGVLVYTNRINGSKFIGETSHVFDLLKESDYEFLLRAKYGDLVIDPEAVYMKRVRNGCIVIVALLCFFITNLNFMNIFISFVVGFLIFKAPYNDLRKYYKSHLNLIDGLLPYYLKSLEVLVHHYTVPVALARSIEDAPDVFKPGLRELIAKIEAGDSSVDPYMEFAQQYPVRDSMRMMRLLYRLGLGEQEKKHTQLMSFAKTVSALQAKAREQKYQARLDTMERQTMTMLVCTGGGALILLLISIFMSLGSAV